MTVGGRELRFTADERCATHKHVGVGRELEDRLVVRVERVGNVGERCIAGGDAVAECTPAFVHDFARQHFECTELMLPRFEREMGPRASESVWRDRKMWRRECAAE